MPWYKRAALPFVWTERAHRSDENTLEGLDKKLQDWAGMLQGSLEDWDRERAKTPPAAVAQMLPERIRGMEHLANVVMYSAFQFLTKYERPMLYQQPPDVRLTSSGASGAKGMPLHHMGESADVPPFPWKKDISDGDSCRSQAEAKAREFLNAVKNNDAGAGKAIVLEDSPETVSRWQRLAGALRREYGQDLASLTAVRTVVITRPWHWAAVVVEDPKGSALPLAVVLKWVVVKSQGDQVEWAYRVCTAEPWTRADGDQALRAYLAEQAGLLATTQPDTSPATQPPASQPAATQAVGPGSPRTQPAVGVELSRTPGVSIVRVPPNRSRGSNSSGGSKGKAHLEMEGRSLLDALVWANQKQRPIVQSARLPAGEYRIVADTEDGGWPKILEMLSGACSQAFGVRVSRRDIETEVLVMTCPRPAMLKLNRSQETRSGFLHKTDNNRWECPFTASMKDLAWYAGYMMRAEAVFRDRSKQDKVLATAVVDETGLEGFYEGYIAWDGNVEGSLLKALEGLGLAFAPGKRKVEALVIEPAAATQPGTGPASHPASTQADAGTLERLWDDLGSAESGVADKAAAGLSAAAEAAVAFLKGKLAPPSVEGIEKFIADLDSDQFEVRRKAQEALRELDQAAVPVLTKAGEGQGLSAEARDAIQALLREINAPIPATPRARRMERLVSVLAGINSDSSKRLLKDLAGRGDSRLARLAQAALARLAAPVVMFGAVRDEQGRAIADAEVLLYYHRSHWGFENQVVETVRTDRTGAFRFTRPLVFEHLNGTTYTDHYYILGRHPDYALGWQLVLSGEERPPRELVLTSPAEQSFQVLDKSGKPLANMRVWLYGAGNETDKNPNLRTYLHLSEDIQVLGTVSDADGRVILRNLPRTDLSLNCSGDGYADTFIRVGTPSARPREVRMGPAAPVSGIVRDPEGKPVEGAVVRFGAAWSLNQYWLARTDKDGRYGIPNLVPKGGSWTPDGGSGQYTVQLDHPRFAMIQKTVQVEAGKVTQADIDASPGTLIRGRVLEPGTNRPIPGARVQADTPSGRLNAYADDMGEFTWRAVPGQGMAFFISPPKGFFVKTNHLTQQVGITGQEMRLDIYAPSEVRPLVAVRGKVVLGDGSPAAGAVVWPGMDSDFETYSGNAIHKTITAGDGGFEFPSVPSDRQLVLYMETADRTMAGTASLDVSRERAATVRLLPTVSAEALLNDGSMNVWPRLQVEVRPKVDGRMISFCVRTVSTDADGRLKIAGILPGLEYVVADARYYHSAIRPADWFQAVTLVLAPSAQPGSATQPAVRDASPQATQPGEAGEAERIRGLIEQLGASKFEERQAAQQALVGIGPAAVPALRAASGDTGLERALRAKEALASIGRRGDRITSILDVQPPFTLAVRTVTLQGKPQAGVKVRCVHPRPERAKPLVDMVVPTDANGVATFTVNSADLLADRSFWISLSGREFLGDGVWDLSPIDRRFDSTWVVLPTRPFRLLVVNERDEPLPAATVVLELNLRPAVEGLHSITNMRVAHTDSKGQAVIDFPDEETSLYTVAKGYASSTVTKARLSADRPFVIRLSRGATIAGQVHTRGATPVRGVVLNAKKHAPGHHGQEFTLTAVSDAAGKFSLVGASPGRWEITAHVEDGRLYAFAPLYVEVPENQRTTEVRVLSREEPLRPSAVPQAPQSAMEITMVALPAFRLKGKYVASRPETMAWERELVLASKAAGRNAGEGYRLEFPVCRDGTFDLVFEVFDDERSRGCFIFMGEAGYYARVKVPGNLRFFTVPDREHYLDFASVPSGTYGGFEVALLRTSTLWGRLLDSRGQPLAEHEVLVDPGGTFSKTDKEGQFTTEIPPLKEIQLRFRQPGEQSNWILRADLEDVKEGQIVEKTFVATMATGSPPAPPPATQPGTQPAGI